MGFELFDERNHYFECMTEEREPYKFDLFGRPQKCSKYDHEILISWTMILIFRSAGSPEISLSNEV